MIMEWVNGIQIDDREWWELSPEIREKLCYKIGLQLQQLRAIPAPQPHYYGRIHDQPFYPSVFRIGGYRHDEPAGPFYTYESYLERLLISSRWRTVWRMVMNRPESENIDNITKLLSSTWSEQWSRDKQACEPKLTHGDVELRNIIFVKSQDNGERLEERDVVLVDWEFLAWMPAWEELRKLDDTFGLWGGEGYWTSMLGFAKAIRPFPFNEAKAAKLIFAAMGVN